MMSQSIVNEVINYIQKELGDNFEIKSQEIRKNNGKILNGISLRANTNRGIASIIYIDDLLYRGLNTQDIAKQVLLRYKSNIGTDQSFTNIQNRIKHYDKIKDGLRIVLINKQRNKELLKEIPHMDYLDLVIVIEVAFKEENTSVTVTNNLLELWHKDSTNVMSDAMVNFHQEKSIITSDEDIFKKFIESAPSEPFVYILSNESCYKGAIRMQDELSLTLFAMKHDVDQILIIPSSIHEVLLVPIYDESDLDINKEAINELIREVNQNVVLPEEVLSDHCYIWKKGIGITY